MKYNKRSAGVLFLVFLLLIFIASLTAQSAHAAVPFTQAYNTLTNSRFSFKGSLNTAIAAGGAIATITGSGFSDNDIDNLFNGDVICLNGNTGAGCIDQSTFTVNNRLSNTSFAFTPTLTGSAMAGDSVVSTQSGQMTITFRPTTNLASGSRIILSVPSASSGYNNGIPDSTGFDSAELPADLLAGTCAANACFSASGFTVSAVAFTAGAATHTVNITTSAALNNTTTYSFTLGHASNAKLRFLNPSPSGTSHVAGVADVYSFTLASWDNGQTVNYDSTNMKVAPIDGVFVSANVELSISYSINDSGNGYGGNIGSSTNVTQCNGGTFTTSVATTATTVPFGSILNFDTFYRAAQSHYVVTNATNGYTVTVKYDTPLTSGANQIADGTCDGACTTTSEAAWATATNNGFGYTLGNITGTEAAWTPGTSFRIFGTSPVSIMTKASQTSGARVATCYQLSVDATQPNGLYYNKLTYVATPRF